MSAVLGKMSDASFVNEKQPFTSQKNPEQADQSFPGGPPTPAYSIALNWYTVTGRVDTR